MASEKRLIDASAWKSFYDDKKNILDRFYTHDAGYEDAIDNVDDWMDAQPVVDAVEVVHGRWENEGKVCACSCCKQQFNGFLAPNWNYCPNCGAKMDGERKDND